MGSAQLFPGPGPDQARWGLTDRIKDFFYHSLAVPCPFSQRSPGSLSMLDEGVEVLGPREWGAGSWCTQTVEENLCGVQRPLTWPAQQLNVEAQNLQPLGH